MKYIQAIVLTLVLVAPLSAQAHGGEDHGDAAPAAVAGSLAPRAQAQTELFELLATAEQGQLLIYLDRFDSNAPVADAKVEVESGSWHGTALAGPNGIFRVAAPQFKQPGTYPLVFTVQAGKDNDLIEATLTVAPTPLSAPSKPHALAAWPIAIALLALAGIGWIVWRRMRHMQKG
ncbi:hypothetical protein SAMN02745857_03815 [Andreprevotia lacus DSM 23236]|uniref:Nickel transport protein n=1 Tax=Andreprevotia lacus DSM 23236 TaxID=1121001 RepID=A0A1W1XZJ5_9NEIS|nr:hypothetical protein [Andreprevotia lacus]SMC29399.1 hypothetical protein SAMN02745857_03815 [Andreprevotia lacus DSM 23236]